MKSPNRLAYQLSAASGLVLAACGVLAQQAQDETYTPLGLENRPSQSHWQGNSPGALQLGGAYTSDDNYMFGEYNGLSNKGGTVIGNLQWQDFSGTGNYWQGYVSNIGLDTREGALTWGKPGKLSLSVGFDSQVQVSNDNGKTPFNGNAHQVLPQDWVSGSNTGDWTTLDESLHGFSQELKRNKLFLDLDTRLNQHWQLETDLSYEEKTGHADVGGAIYIDQSGGDAVLLRAPVDYATTEASLGLSYSNQRLNLAGSVNYSDFDNKDDVLTWQNPYSDFSPNVRYPDGIGGLGLAPDNDQWGGRLTGQYMFSARTRLQVDGSYAVASQNQDYLDYSVNPLLSATVPVPENNFGGEVDTSTLNARLLFSPMKKLDAEIFYKYRDRNYDADRDGYQYIRGDGSNQPGTDFTVYNTNHDYTAEIGGFEVNYRLPLRSKATFQYEYEEDTRENAATEHTKEDRYTLGYRIQPWSNLTAKLEVLYADRRADTYQWAQSYYALLDTGLINATPDNQRYINHPDLMQYYLANREQWQTRADFTWLPADQWNLNLNLQWRDDNYDASELGLTSAEWYRAYFSSSYIPTESLSATVYIGYDYYETDQQSRAFNGGPEKDAFEIYPPLPQASDPSRDWQVHGKDTSYTAGANIQWQVASDIALTLDYNYVDTRAEQDMGTDPASGLTASDLPTVNTRLNHVQLSGTWQVEENLALQLDYQYYRYKSDDWAWSGVQPDTIGKVLTFGQGNPNERINYVGASVIYHWE